MVFIVRLKGRDLAVKLRLLLLQRGLHEFEIVLLVQKFRLLLLQRTLKVCDVADRLRECRKGRAVGLVKLARVFRLVHERGEILCVEEHRSPADVAAVLVDVLDALLHVRVLAGPARFRLLKRLLGLRDLGSLVCNVLLRRRDVPAGLVDLDHQIHDVAVRRGYLRLYLLLLNPKILKFGFLAGKLSLRGRHLALKLGLLVRQSRHRKAYRHDGCKEQTDDSFLHKTSSERRKIRPLTFPLQLVTLL